MSPGKKSSTVRKNLTLCSYEGLVATPLVYLCLPGNFIIAMLLTQVFDLSDTTFGIIVSLPAWANVVQVGLFPLMMRRWTQKQITVVFAWLNLFCWGAFALLLPKIPIENPEISSRLLFWIFVGVGFTYAIVSVSWTSWVQEWTPERVRGKYFGRRNRMLQIVTVLFVFGAGLILDRLGSTNPIEAFQLVIAISIVLRATSILAQRRILSTSAARETESSRDWIEQLKLLRGAPSFRRFILFGVVFGFVANCIGPFFNVFMLDTLRMPISALSWLVVIASVTSALSLPAWGMMLDRFGNKPVMVFTLVAWMLPGYFWVFAEPGRTWMLYPMWAWGGLISSGFLLGSFNLLLKLVPPEAKTISISIHVGATALAAAVAPILGGSMLDLFRALEVDPLRLLHWTSVVHHTAVIATALVLHSVVEPKSTTLRSVVGAMRSYRQIGALLGVSFLVQHTFLKRDKDQ